MDWRVLVVPAFVASIAACSPFGGGAFACSDNSQCGATGICTAGFCAFADSTCSSGERYGTASGPMSNQCVGAPTPAIDSSPGSEPPPPGIDAKQFLDAPAPGTVCYGVGLAKACFATPPVNTITLTAAINTDNSQMCSTLVMGNPPWCVIAGNEVVVSGTVVATGGKPLVLVAVDKVDVSGTLSAASTRTGGEVIGASADFAMCDAGTPPTNNGAGGGAGGSFGGAGGNGGDGPTANTHGKAGATQTPAAMRGGCPGQTGDGNGANGGKAGHGGGSLALDAGGSVTVEGAVNASGEAGGGGAAADDNGGGGGGAGGLIVLDAPTVTVTGQVFTNGGGGAEGGSKNPDLAGADGNDPTVGGAAASNNNANGGNGGPGGFGMTAAGPGAAVAGHSGGGGGGGVGVIKLFQATSIGGGGQISPPQN